MSTEAKSGEVRDTDVEKIIGQLREEISRKRKELSPSASLSRVDQAVSADLATLRADYDIYNTQFTSHRPVLGRFIILGKKIVREFLNPILVRQVAYNGANARVAAYLEGRVEALGDNAQAFHETQQQVRNLMQRCSKLEEERLHSFQELRQQIETLQRQQAKLKEEGLATQALALKDLQEQLENLRLEEAQLKDEQPQLSAAVLAAQSQALQGMRQLIDNLNLQHMQALESLNQQQAQALEPMRERLSRAERKLRRIIYALGDGRDDAEKHNLDGKTVPLHMLEPDFDYFGFEERFRGAEETIKARQAQYVEVFKGHEPVLDIGCGRGEFLELLRASGINATGVDLDLDMVLLCRDKGLDVAQHDALDNLANRPDDSLGGVFSAQVIEHLEPPVFVHLLKLCHQKLRPGGILLLETLNPESLMVHYRWFCMDFSHKRLVHPDTLQFLLQSLGFRDIRRTSPTPSETSALIPRLELDGQPSVDLARFNQAIEHLNALLYASADYAMVAQK